MKVGSVNHWYDVAFELIEEISNMIMNMHCQTDECY